MSTLYNSYCNVICVPKKPQLCFIGPQCNFTPQFHYRIFHILLYKHYLLFRGIIFSVTKRIVGNIHQDKPPVSQKMEHKYLILVL